VREAAAASFTYATLLQCRQRLVIMNDDGDGLPDGTTAARPGDWPDR
jgi:hypothetical protein